MSAAGRLLYALSDDGTSFEKMARIAAGRGVETTGGRLQQIAAGNRGKRLTDDALRAVAAVLGVQPIAIAMMEAQDMYLVDPLSADTA